MFGLKYLPLSQAVHSADAVQEEQSSYKHPRYPSTEIKPNAFGHDSHLISCSTECKGAYATSTSKSPKLVHSELVESSPTCAACRRNARETLLEGRAQRPLHTSGRTSTNGAVVCVLNPTSAMLRVYFARASPTPIHPQAWSWSVPRTPCGPVVLVGRYD